MAETNHSNINLEALMEEICNSSSSIITMCGASIAANNSQPEVLEAITAMAQKTGYIADRLIREGGSAGCVGTFDDWLKVGRRAG